MTSRREFIEGGLALSLASLFTGCHEKCAPAPPFAADPNGILELAAGLSYVVIDQVGDRMSDGLPVPRKPDGMACFDSPEGWVLMRNQEISSERSDPENAHAEAFDPSFHGGVTRVVLDPETLAVLSSNQVLTGTKKNCGGGVTPWGWLSCEETTLEGHGWVFLCDHTATVTQPPNRIDAYGRFKHEAAVYDVSTGICYLTEDENDSCLYRFVPDDRESPFGSGRLQALAIVGNPRAATTRFDEGKRHDIEWVDVRETDTGEGVHEAAFEAGAAKFVRGEGAWFEDGRVVFAVTGGGPIQGGQIFELDIAAQTLEVLAVVRNRSGLYRPDNVAVGPRGGIWICEDNRCQCVLHLRTSDGCIHPVARTSVEENELAGVCFSPDGSVMFVNLWGTGVTVAILGLEDWDPSTKEGA